MISIRRKPKKSEKIEVRISHEEKRDLQALARQRGQTVSTIVRGLVADHLKASRRAELQTSIRERTDMILKPASMHPRKLAAALVASLGFGAMLLPAAVADPMTVELQGNFQRNSDQFKEQHRFNSTIELEPGMPGTFITDTPESDVDGYRIELTVSPDEDDHLLIAVKIYRGTQGDDLIAEPRILTEAGQEGRVVIDGTDESYEISIKVDDA